MSNNLIDLLTDKSLNSPLFAVISTNLAFIGLLLPITVLFILPPFIFTVGKLPSPPWCSHDKLPAPSVTKAYPWFPSELGSFQSIFVSKLFGVDNEILFPLLDFKFKFVFISMVSVLIESKINVLDFKLPNSASPPLPGNTSHDKLPFPSVINPYPFRPSLSGNFQIVSTSIFWGATNPTKFISFSL